MLKWLYSLATDEMHKTANMTDASCQSEGWCNCWRLGGKLPIRHLFMGPPIHCIMVHIVQICL